MAWGRCPPKPRPLPHPLNTSPSSSHHPPSWSREVHRPGTNLISAATGEKGAPTTHLEPAAWRGGGGACPAGPGVCSPGKGAARQAVGLGGLSGGRAPRSPGLRSPAVWERRAGGQEGAAREGGPPRVGDEHVLVHDLVRQLGQDPQEVLGRQRVRRQGGGTHDRCPQQPSPCPRTGQWAHTPVEPRMARCRRSSMLRLQWRLGYRLSWGSLTCGDRTGVCTGRARGPCPTNPLSAPSVMGAGPPGPAPAPPGADRASQPGTAAAHTDGPAPASARPAGLCLGRAHSETSHGGLGGPASALVWPGAAARTLGAGSMCGQTVVRPEKGQLCLPKPIEG